MIIRDNVSNLFPSGWRLLSLKELGIYRDLAKKVMEEKSKARIGDGWTFSGSGNGFQIKKEEVGEDRLLIREQGE